MAVKVTVKEFINLMKGFRQDKIITARFIFGVNGDEVADVKQLGDGDKYEMDVTAKFNERL